jgi:hypothetical protein
MSSGHSLRVFLTEHPFLPCSQWLTLDIASEAPEHYSEELVSATRPPVYVPFEIDPPDTEMFATR